MNTVKTLKPLALVAVMSVTQLLCAAVDDDPFAGDWIYEVTVSDAAPGFSLFGVSNGTATVVGHGFPIVSGTGPYHSNVCSVAATGPFVTFPEEMFCEVSCSSDDDGCVAVGGVSAASRLNSPGSASGFLAPNVAHPVSAGFSSVGGPYFFNCAVTLAPAQASAPRLKLARAVVYFSTKRPPSTQSGHGPHIVGEERPGRVYEIVAEGVPDGCALVDGEARVDPASPLWKGASPATLAVTYRLLEDGDVVDTAVGVFVREAESASDCRCGCGEGTRVGSGSVDFAQPFGRTPWRHGLPVGTLRLRATAPSARLGTPAALFYDHPMRRRVVHASPLSVTIGGDEGDFVEYGADGLPVGSSRGEDRQLLVDGEGRYVEVLPDRTRLAFDPVTRRVASIFPPDGGEVPVGALGISCLYDGGGALTNVSSVADGEISVSATSSDSFTAVWRAPSGAFVKSFTFSRPSRGVLSLHERRDDAFSFDYRWEYDDAAMDWTFLRGFGAGAVRESKSLSWDETNGAWAVERVVEDGSGAAALMEASLVDSARPSPVSLGREVGGVAVSSATLDGASGRVAVERALGKADRFFSYDAFGRLLTNATVSAGGLADVTVYEYPPHVGGLLERRPTRETRRLGGVAVSETETLYGSNRITRIRRFGGEERASFEEFDGRGRTTLAVREDGRATAFAFSEAGEDLSWTRTATEGIWADGAFSAVPGKSTRLVETFDAAGNVAREVHEALVGDEWRELSWTTNRYDAAHRKVFSERSDGRTEAAEWICAGPVWERSAEGVVVSNRYDGAKRKVSSTRHAPHGAVETTLTLDAMGRVLREVEVAGPLTNESVRVYDPLGRVVSETDPAGRTTLTARSDDGLVTTATFADSGVRVRTLNADGSLRSVTGTAVTPAFHTHGVASNGLRWTEVRFGREDSPRFERRFVNGFGETVRVERSGFGGAVLVTENAYDAKGRLVSTTETGKPAAAYAYDSWGDLVSTTRSADGVTRTVTLTDANILLDGEVWRERTRTVSTGDPAIPPLAAKTLTRLSGLSLGRLSETLAVDERGNTNRTWTALDPSAATRTEWRKAAEASNVASTVFVDGVPTRTVDAGCVTNAAAYDAFRRVVSTTDGRGNATTYAYDGKGRLASRTDAAGHATSYAHDAMGRVTAETNALGGVTLTRYDLRGNKTYEGGATYPVSYAYDAYGNRTAMTTYRDEEGAVGDTTTWVYDEASGLMTQKSYADGQGPCYTYTADGKLASRTWARGVTTSYSYDTWGNATNTSYSDGTPSVSLAYDALGRLASAVDAAGTTTYSYNPFGDEEEVSVSGLYAKTLRRHRDAFGRDTGLTLDNSRQSVIEYEADTARMRRVAMAGAQFIWYYLPGTHLKSRLQYGYSGSAHYSYEPCRDILTQVRNHVNGGVLSQYDYESDALGRRMSISRSGSMMSEGRTDLFAYNARGELVSVAREAESGPLAERAYAYDDAGNRLSSLDLGTNRVYLANALNQHTNVTECAESFTPQFDADGNQTLVKTSTGVWSVAYDGENRPILWTRGADSVALRFDRLGRRVERVETTLDPATSAPVTNRHEKFVYDGFLAVQRLDGAAGDAVDLAFGWDPSERTATRPLVIRRPGAFNLFATFDGNKDVSELVFFRQANGVAAHYEYAPFGEVTATNSATPVTSHDFIALNPLRFSSEFADDALGLVYYNYRHYEPVAGRWLTRDPLGELVAPNPYVFCHNAPDSTDWLGLAESCDRVGNFKILSMKFSLTPQDRMFNQDQIMFEAEKLLGELVKLGFKTAAKMGDMNPLLTLLIGNGISFGRERGLDMDDFGNRLQDFSRAHPVRIDGTVQYQLCKCINGKLQYEHQRTLADGKEVNFGHIYDLEQYQKDAYAALGDLVVELLSQLKGAVENARKE